MQTVSEDLFRSEKVLDTNGTDLRNKCFLFKNLRFRPPDR